MGGGGQCSPKNLAQQVRDHSWPVRQKICAKNTLTFLGGGGSEVRDMTPLLL